MPAALASLRSAFPAEGLFAEKSFLLSPEPLRLAAPLVAELGKLGHRLFIFQRAQNELYQRSLSGKAPAWIAELLDRGKPPELLALTRAKAMRGELPAIIRPDLLLTAEGFSITELDSVPGGLGLTGWLSQTYGALGYDVIGGPRGMLDGLHSILGDRADILVSDESDTYRPEMRWLASQAAPTADWRVLDAAAPYPPTGQIPAETIYRFFELFDLPNLPPSLSLFAKAAARELRLTPPAKPWLEEKMWLALFWLRPLRDYWRRELTERNFLELQRHIPQSWLLDPTPLPPHAVLPGLEINDWNELSTFSQKQRDLVLKISGFSPGAWGSRSVVIGTDVPQPEWAAAVQHALADWPHHPWLLMRFAHTKLIEHPYFHPETGEVLTLRGRVRLCPYYFVSDGKTKLGGALATIVPADKKIVHGMRDAILVPAVPE